MVVMGSELLGHLAHLFERTRTMDQQAFLLVGAMISFDNRVFAIDKNELSPREGR